MKELISGFTWVDILVAVGILRGCYVGFRSGLFPELLRISSYVVSVVAAFQLEPYATQYLTLNTFLNEASARVISYVALLIIFFVIAKLAVMILLKLLKIGDGNFVYKFLGLLIGAARWAILISLLFIGVDYLPIQGLKADIHERSMVGQKVASITPTLFEFLSTLSPQLAIEKKA